MDKLKKYVCRKPFEYIDIQPNEVYVCCHTWLPTSIGRSDDIEGCKNSDTLREIQESVLDGSYRFCDKKICPYLSTLIHTDEVPVEFIPIEQFDRQKLEQNKEILFGYDRSCNLKCPSCRSELIANDKEDTDEFRRKQAITKAIDDHYSSTMKTALITGSGDPFFSKVYREYLINFDASKYPQLENIQLITNGNLLTEKMWSSMKAAPFVKTIEISIDAANKDTYENKTRLNGDWDALISNLKFLSTVDTLETVIVSMVVQKSNFNQMLDFYNLMNGIFADSSFDLWINFRQIAYWGSGAYSPLQIRELQPFDSSHELFEQFMVELKKIHGLPNISHNFHHLIDHD